jgi:hypothetical protein
MNTDKIAGNNTRNKTMNRYLESITNEAFFVILLYGICIFVAQSLHIWVD